MGRDDGIQRRFLVLELKRTFKDGEADPLLAVKLLEEKHRIFMWALLGLNRLLARGGFGK